MKLYDVKREAIDQKLAMLDSKISIALDLWTSPAQMPFFGLVGHFIDEDWVPRTLLIDFAPLTGSHTGERIYNAFRNIISESVRAKLMAVVCDNASNNDSFIQKLIDDSEGFTPEHHIRCMAHILHLAASVPTPPLLICGRRFSLRQPSTWPTRALANCAI